MDVSAFEAQVQAELERLRSTFGLAAPSIKISPDAYFESRRSEIPLASRGAGTEGGAVGALTIAPRGSEGTAEPRLRIVGGRIQRVPSTQPAPRETVAPRETLSMPANADAEAVSRAIQNGQSFTRFRKDRLNAEDRHTAEAAARARERVAADLDAQMAEKRAQAEMADVLRIKQEIADEKWIERGVTAPSSAVDVPISTAASKYVTGKDNKDNTPIASEPVAVLSEVQGRRLRAIAAAAEAAKLVRSPPHPLPMSTANETVSTDGVDEPHNSLGSSSRGVRPDTGLAGTRSVRDFPLPSYAPAVTRENILLDGMRSAIGHLRSAQEQHFEGSDRFGTSSLSAYFDTATRGRNFEVPVFTSAGIPGTVTSASAQPSIRSTSCLLPRQQEGISGALPTNSIMAATGILPLAEATVPIGLSLDWVGRGRPQTAAREDAPLQAVTHVPSLSAAGFPRNCLGHTTLSRPCSPITEQSLDSSTLLVFLNDLGMISDMRGKNQFVASGIAGRDVADSAPVVSIAAASSSDHLLPFAADTGEPIAVHVPIAFNEPISVNKPNSVHKPVTVNKPITDNEPIDSIQPIAATEPESPAALSRFDSAGMISHAEIAAALQREKVFMVSHPSALINRVDPLDTSKTNLRHEEEFAAVAADASSSGNWGLDLDTVALHNRRLLAFYAVHAPPKAHAENVTAAWKLFGPRIWDELERKYKGKTAGFRPTIVTSVDAAIESSARATTDDDYADNEFQ